MGRHVAVLAVCVAVLVMVLPVARAADQPRAQASCGPCVVVGGAVAVRAGMYALGAGVSAGGAKVVGDAISRARDEARYKAEKARRTPGKARSLIDRAKYWRDVGRSIWRVTNGKIIRIIRFFKRYGNHLGPKLPGMAKACLIVGSVIYAVGGSLEDARNGCIGAAFGVARS